MVIQESINNRDEEMCKLVAACKESNCRVSLTILAVDKATSNVGVLSRYESAVRSINSGEVSPSGARRTPGEYHDDAYASLTEPGKYEGLMPYLDEVVVSGRNGSVFYQSSTDFSPEEIVQAIKVGRSKKPDNRAELFEGLLGAVQFNMNYRNPELRR